MIKKFNKSTSQFNTFLFSILFILLTSLPTFAQTAAEGKTLFVNTCSSCHTIGKGDLTGPDLKGVNERRDVKWLHSWIKNPPLMIKNGDPIALELKAAYATIMPAQNLDDKQIDAILAYIKEYKPPVKGPVDTGDKKTAGSGFYSTTTLVSLALLFTVLLIIAIVLIKIKSTVNTVVRTKFPELADPDAEPSFWETLPGRWRRMNKTLFVLGIMFVAILFFGYYGYIFGMEEVGVQQGYAPTQPIAFPHDVHAGTYKIDCKYCHSTVEKSKQASIPSLNTCMNCHKQGGVTVEGSKELEKLVTAFETNTPVKWIRIHNLPDHAYFNHSQHVKVGKVECKSCHGEVDKMKVVTQQATLQMGWCIDCHNKSKVDVANNKYYTELHSRMKAEHRPFVTVANNGGLECSKCHY